MSPTTWSAVADPLCRRPDDGEALEDLDRRRADLEELRQRVMNVVGHALRTPMATLRGHIEVVAQDPDRVADDEFRDSLLRSARRVEALLDDLLIASGVETRLPVGRPQPLRLVNELQGVLDDLPHGADLEPHLEIVGGVGAEVRVPRDGLRWILQRLLRNALVYGGRRVVADIREQGDRVVLRLQSPDSQARPDDLEHAFELFYRGEQAVMTDAIGLGVGLPVARRLAEHAGGTLHLEAGARGRGVTAVLEMPAP